MAAASELLGVLVVNNRLPIADTATDEFIDLFEERTAQLRDVPGFQGVELLTPVDADYHVIQAYWESRAAFEQWRDSKAFETMHADLPGELLAGPNQLELYEVDVTVDTAE